MLFEGYIVETTARAVLFHCHYWERSDWMPKSQITIQREEDTDEVRVLASSWICKQKELAEFQHRDNVDEKTSF